MMKIGLIQIYGNDITLSVLEGRKRDLRLVEQRKFSGIEAMDDGLGFDAAVLSLPLDILQFRRLRLPFSDMNKLKEVVPYELKRLVLDDIDDIVFDCVVRDADNGNKDLLITFVKRGWLEDILRALNAKGIDPSIVISLELSKVIKGGGFDGVFSENAGVDLHELGELLAGEMDHPTINLRQGDLSFTKEYREKARYKKRALVLLFFLLAVLLFNSGERVYIKRKAIKNIDFRMNGMYTELFPGSKRVIDPLYQTRARLKALKGVIKDIEGIDPLNLISVLSERWSPGVVLAELNIDTDFFVLKGSSSQLKDIERLVSRLGEVFPDIEISETDRTVDGKLRYVIKGTTGPAGKAFVSQGEKDEAG